CDEQSLTAQDYDMQPQGEMPQLDYDMQTSSPMSEMPPMDHHHDGGHPGESDGPPMLEPDGSISPEELYHHFDVDGDGRVDMKDYAEHVDYHCEHPELLDDYLDLKDYRRDDVLTVSLHADPERFYPFFWGYEQEKGEDQGLGYNLNLPLARGTGDDDFLNALDIGLARVRNFGSDVVVVALGLDASIDDPFEGLAITQDGFERIGARIASLGLPCLMVQEGGYISDSLGINLTRFLTGVQS
ncbi:MAG: hypothetical protein EBY53_02565, partial [Rhodobacteraceae bacterium]|nr:hypothetical protein [Paracoccaceae bacterium]